jgi:hypothetical protein
MVAGLLGRRINTTTPTTPHCQYLPLHAMRIFMLNHLWVSIDYDAFQPIPLEGVNVSALVHDFSSQVTVEQVGICSDDE